MNSHNKKFIKMVVADSIAVLLREAEAAFQKHPERASRYLKMAWALVKKHRVRLTREQKFKFCKKCFTLWVPGKTVKISFDRVNNMFEFTCAVCGYKRRTR